jgi:hypothetical protein
VVNQRVKGECIMDKVFEKILEIENRAKEVYAEAVQKKEQIEDRLHDDIKIRKAEITEMTDAKIRQLVLSGEKELQEGIERINRKLQEKLMQLDEQVSKCATKWEDIIFSNVIGD